MGRKKRMIALVAVLLVAGNAGTSYAAADDAVRGTEAAIAGSAYSQAEKTALRQKAHESVDAGVSAEDVRIIVQGAAARGMDAVMVERLLEQAAAVQRSGLPAAPVANVIEQGIAKGITGERILAAAERLTTHLRSADSVVGTVEKKGISAGSPEIRLRVTQQVAGALQRGIGTADAEALGTTGAEAKATLSQYGRAVETSATLGELGMPKERALAIARRGLLLGYPEPEYAKMERRLMEYNRGGMSWEESFREMNGVMERSMRNSGRTTGPGGGLGAGPSSGSSGRMRMDRK